ncbi:MAG: zinc ribbon domain-containing protein [Thermoplasmata archaeon]
MFEKREVRMISGVRREDLWAKAWDWWGRAGFHLSQSGPYRMMGSSFYSRIGLKREFELSLDDVSGGCSVDLRVNAQITDEGVVLGGISAIVFWPVAVVGGAVSYTQYEDDARNLMIAFWQHVYALAAPGAPAPASTPAVPPPCTGCGAALLPDWKVCPYCGRPRANPP